MTDSACSGLPDKRQVAASFSRAAASYDEVAELQRDVGEHLLGLLPAELAAQRWVDLGCGTGYFSRALQGIYPQAEGLAVDIAEGMLRFARERGGVSAHVGGDAERLPLRESCCDLLFSSLAIQWCADLLAVLAEARRVLRPGGVAAFSSLCVGTLGELRAAWQRVDGYAHVNRFRDAQAYRAAVAASGLDCLALEVEDRVLHFPDVRRLTHELKALGAHNLNPGRPGGLTGRARVRALVEAYEHYREPAGLPATYRVIHLVLRRP